MFQSLTDEELITWSRETFEEWQGLAKRVLGNGESLSPRQALAIRIHLAYLASSLALFDTVEAGHITREEAKRIIKEELMPLHRPAYEVLNPNRRETGT